MKLPALQAQLAPVHERLQAGDIAEAVRQLNALKQEFGDDAIALQNIAETALLCGQHKLATECQERSAALRPHDPDVLFNLAVSRLAHGQLNEAERLLLEVIRLRPEDGGARLNLSGLRRQSKDSNHIEQLLFLREQLAPGDPGHIPFCYALAKELEDLERYDESWRQLQEGAQRRRAQIQYDVGDEEATLAEIAARFKPELFEEFTQGHVSDRPIFILGMPRSGSTLLDRMLSSHSRIGSLGEHNTLVLALLRAAGSGLNKQQLLEQAVQIDFSALGAAYCRSIKGFGNTAHRLIDKTPQNFLYLGLIRLALPKAKIIHIRRHPLDSCYAVYKTLFRAGYPFSYRLQELGRYYIAYSRLMDHWRKVIPDAFIDLEYERLVSNPEAELKRVLAYLDLEWEDSCLAFHRQDGIAATASAAQVRRPIHTRSVGLWRRYEEQLGPFANKLREHGIDV